MSWWMWLVAVFVLVELVFVVVGIPAIVRRRRRRALDLAGTDVEASVHAHLPPGQIPYDGTAPTVSTVRRRPFTALAIVFTAIGLVLGTATAISVAVTAGSISGNLHAQGVVVDNHRSGRSIVPVVEFATPSGATIRFDGSIGSSPPRYPVGTRVAVRYDPDNPNNAAIDEYWETYFLPTLLGLIGIPFLVIGIAFGVFARIRRLRRG